MTLLKEAIPAPIIVFPYNRPCHFGKTIAALKANALSNDSDLYIYSDAPKNSAVEGEVLRVREMCRNISGFRSVTVTEREHNLGPCESFRQGITEAFSKYDAAIIFDDDTICSPHTLSFLNTCLTRYRLMTDVFSITAWCPPHSLFRIPETYPFDIFFMPRNGSWGWAIWKDRWDKIDWELADYEEFSQNKILVKEFARYGEDLPHILKMQYCGEIDTWDIQICYTQFKSRTVTIYPTLSYTKNIGLDGSGTHFKSDTSRFATTLLPTKKNRGSTLPRLFFCRRCHADCFSESIRFTTILATLHKQGSSNDIWA